MKVRAKEKNFTFPYVFDEGQKVYPVFGAKKTPHVYILNKEKVKHQKETLDLLKQLRHS